MRSSQWTRFLQQEHCQLENKELVTHRAKAEGEKKCLKSSWVRNSSQQPRARPDNETQSPEKHAYAHTHIPLTRKLYTQKMAQMSNWSAPSEI